MGYFLKWVFLLNCLGFGGGMTFAQTIVDTLKTCVEPNLVNDPTINETIDEKTENRQRLVVEYELSQKMFKDIYSKGHKDVYVQLCLNNQLVTELDSSACGDLGRVKGRRGKLRIEFNRLTTGEPESAHLYGILLEEEKPPVKKWVLKSFLSPHWAHKQMETFNPPKDLLPQKIPEVTDTLSSKKAKKKKRKTASIIGGLLVVGGLMKLTSIAK